MLCHILLLGAVRPTRAESEPGFGVLPGSDWSPLHVFPAVVRVCLSACVSSFLSLYFFLFLHATGYKDTRIEAKSLTGWLSASLTTEIGRGTCEITGDDHGDDDSEARWRGQRLKGSGVSCRLM